MCMVRKTLYCRGWVMWLLKCYGHDEERFMSLDSYVYGDALTSLYMLSTLFKFIFLLEYKVDICIKLMHYFVTFKTIFHLPAPYIEKSIVWKFVVSTNICYTYVHNARTIYCYAPRVALYTLHNWATQHRNQSVWDILTLFMRITATMHRCEYLRVNFETYIITLCVAWLYQYLKTLFLKQSESLVHYRQSEFISQFTVSVCCISRNGKSYIYEQQRYTFIILQWATQWSVCIVMMHLCTVRCYVLSTLM